MIRLTFLIFILFFLSNCSFSEKSRIWNDKEEKIENQTPEAIPLPDKTVKKIETKIENKQNPDKLDEEVKQVSEFEKKELVDLANIAKLIDKAKEDTAKVIKKNNDITQDQDNKIVT